MTNRTYYSREAEDRANQERAVTTLLLVALGLGIGAVLALMFAPSSGKETRGELAHEVEERFDPVRHASHETVQRLERDLADLRKKVEDRIR